MKNQLFMVLVIYACLFFSHFLCAFLSTFFRFFLIAFIIWQNCGEGKWDVLCLCFQEQIRDMLESRISNDTSVNSTIPQQDRSGYVTVRYALP